MMPLAAFALAACLVPDPASDYIRAVDLAPVFPAMASLAPDTSVLPAPVVGAIRVLRVPELRRLAARFQLSGSPEFDLCFSRAVSQLDEPRLLEAMARSLPQARIEIRAFSHQPVPEGPLEFPLNALSAGAGDSRWSGYVRYAGNRRFSVWALVRVTVAGARVVAREELPHGRPIAAKQVALETTDQPFGKPGWALAIENVVGQSPRQPIHIGETIRLNQLESPKAVLTGETVAVTVHSGDTQLELTAKAEGTGSIGDVILVRNPSSQKRFLARIEAPGKVSIDAGKGAL